MYLVAIFEFHNNMDQYFDTGNNSATTKPGCGSDFDLTLDTYTSLSGARYSIQAFIDIPHFRPPTISNNFGT